MHTDEAAVLLAGLPLLKSAPPQEIAWLMDRGELRSYSAGDVIRTAGSEIDEMDIPLTGRIGIYMPADGGWRKIRDAEAGYVVGAVPYSRMKTAPGNMIVEAETILLALHRKHFPALMVDCPAVTTALVHQMVERARDMRTIEMHNERLLALGKLASGLAHELNNPASAATAAARSLTSLLEDAERAAGALAAARLDGTQLAAIDALRAHCVRTGSGRSALETADREDDFTEWLERHGIDPISAEVLAASDVSLDMLDALADALPAHALDIALEWVAAGASARTAAHHIRTASARIFDLVNAVKGFTFMDREGVPERVDVAQGLAHTTAMLESRSRAKSVDLRIETAADLPGIWGYGSEINQVWQVLIENAIDAVETEGSVTVTASARGDSIIVRVADDGCGIPDENRSRVFDPFFTTKPVGSGAGLGLHQARRIVHLHHGDIDVTSKPGRTVFRVRLPATGTLAIRAEPAVDAG